MDPNVYIKMRIVQQTNLGIKETFIFVSFSERAGIRQMAQALGLGDNVTVSLNRETKQNGRAERISIETDHQLELEWPLILNGSDKLQRKYTKYVLIRLPASFRI